MGLKKKISFHSFALDKLEENVSGSGQFVCKLVTGLNKELYSPSWFKASSDVPHSKEFENIHTG